MAEAEDLRVENDRLRRRVEELEAALAAKPRVNRQALYSLVDAMPFLVAAVDPAGGVDYLSPAFAAWTDPAAGDTAPFLDRLAPPLRAVAEPLTARALAGEPGRVETSLDDSGGGRRDLRIIATPRRDIDGSINGLILFGQDLTDQKRADEALKASEWRLKLAAHAAGLGIWDWDLITNAMVYSEQAKAIYGFPAGEPVTFEQVRDGTHPDDLPTTLGMARRATDPAIREQIPYEYRIVRPDGEVRWVLAHGETVFETPDGVERAVRYVGAIQDITERKAVEAALAESEGRLRLVVDGAAVGAYDVDLDTGESVWSASAFEIMGVEPTPDGRARFDFWQARLHPSDVGRVTAEHAAAAEAGGPWQLTYRIVHGRTGDTRWLTTYGRFLPRPGQAPRSVGVVVDVTNEKRGEERLKLLIHELNHRVKNTLAAVQSIARSSLRGQTSMEAGNDLFTARLMALSSAHDVLTRETWEGAGLREIVAGAVRAYDSPGASRFLIDGVDVRLGPKAALALAMALHELATNAAKYGALSNDTGQVIVRWDARGREDERRLELEWREVGGPPVARPTRSGFGSRLLRQGLKGELGASAQMRFEPEGLVCVIEAPLIAAEALELG